MSPGQFLLALAVMAAGALVQSTIGFGAALVSAPLLLLIDARLIPGPATVAGLSLNLLLVIGHRAHIEWDEVHWPAFGLIPGTVLAAWALGEFSATALAVMSGVVILIAVALSALGRQPRRVPATLLTAGFLSGYMGTVAAVGGPPLALLHRDSTGAQVRAALPPVFMISGVFSLVALAFAGHFDRSDLGLGLALIPGCVIGFLAAIPLTGRVTDRQLRTAVLVVSTASAVLAIARALA